MRSCEGLYQLEVADFRRRPERELVEDGGVLRTLPNGNVVKLVDVLPAAPVRTLVRRAKDNDSAKRWGRKFGTVLKCFKIDALPYLLSVEHTPLEPQIPVTLDIKAEDFTINRNLEVSRARQKGYNIVIDK